MKKPVRRRGYQDGGMVGGQSMSQKITDQLRNASSMAQVMSKFGGGSTKISSSGSGSADAGGGGGGGSGSGGGASTSMSSPASSISPPLDTGAGAGAARGGKIKRTMGPKIGREDGLIAAQKGEYVVRRSAVKKLGTHVLNQVNKGKLPASKAKR